MRDDVAAGARIAAEGSRPTWRRATRIWPFPAGGAALVAAGWDVRDAALVTGAGLVLAALALSTVPLLQARTERRAATSRMRETVRVLAVDPGRTPGTLHVTLAVTATHVEHGDATGRTLRSAAGAAERTTTVPVHVSYGPGLRAALARGEDGTLECGITRGGPPAVALRFPSVVYESPAAAS